MTDELRDARERGWFHIDNVIVDEYLPRIGVTAFAVYACIVRHANSANNAWPSYTLLQQEVRTGRHQIADAVKKIVEVGLVTISPGKRGSNIYHIVTVASGAAEKPVPERNQFPSGTDTSSAPAPTLVPQRHLKNTQGTRPREQDPGEGERERANGVNGHSGLPPPRAVGNLIRFPEPFVVTDELTEWVIEHRMPKKWALNRIESFISHYGTSETMTSLEGWYDKCRKWLLDDWAKRRESGLTERH